jgi:hypothetical protein
MRVLLIATLLAMTAGCTSSIGEDALPGDPIYGANVTVIPATQPQHWTGTAPAGATGCTAAPCPRFEFNVNSTVDAMMTLRWVTAAFDLDIRVADSDGTTIFSAASGAPQTTEVAAGQLSPGAYFAEVISWASAPEDFTLDATFAPRTNSN